MIQSPLPTGKAFAILNERGQLVQPGQRIHAYACFDQGIAHCLHLDTGRMFPLSQNQVQAIFAPHRPAAPKTAPKKTVPTIVFSELPMASNRQQTCPVCRLGHNDIMNTLTDEGMKDIILCPDCSTLYRPWQPPEPAKETFRISRFGKNDDHVIPRIHLGKPARKTAKPEKPTIIFSKLVRAQSRSQECFFCGHEPNHIKKTETDEGPKMLVRCEYSKCQEYMKPFAIKG